MAHSRTWSCSWADPEDTVPERLANTTATITWKILKGELGLAAEKNRVNTLSRWPRYLELFLAIIAFLSILDGSEIGTENIWVVVDYRFFGSAYGLWWFKWIV
jgi:hypothetical protein